MNPIAKLWSGKDWKNALAPFPELTYSLIYMAQHHPSTFSYDECIRFVSGGESFAGQKRLTSQRAQAQFDQLQFKDLEGRSLHEMSNSDMENLRKFAKRQAESPDVAIAQDGERILALIGRTRDSHRLTLEHGTPVNDIKQDIAQALAALKLTPTIVPAGFCVQVTQNNMTHPLLTLASTLALAFNHALVYDHPTAATCLRYPFNDLKKHSLEVHAKDVADYVTTQYTLAFKQNLNKTVLSLDSHIETLCEQLSKAAPTWVCQGEHSGLASYKRATFHQAYPSAQIGLGNKQM